MSGITSTQRYLDPEAPQAPLAQINAEVSDQFVVRRFSPCGLLFTPFCLGQIIFNVIASFAGPLACFWLIFTSMGPESWLGAPMLGIGIASPWACAICSLAFLPVGIPDASKQGWFGIIELESVPCTMRILPFLHVRVGILRHLCIGTVAAALWCPPVFVLARFVEGPMMSAKTFVWFGPSCLAVLPLLVVPLGLLGFALPANYARVEAIMAVRGGTLVKVVRRGILAPTC